MDRWRDRKRQREIFKESKRWKENWHGEREKERENRDGTENKSWNYFALSKVKYVKCHWPLQMIPKLVYTSFVVCVFLRQVSNIYFTTIFQPLLYKIDLIENFRFSLFND
jgi:hypothetical protein